MPAIFLGMLDLPAASLTVSAFFRLWLLSSWVLCAGCSLETAAIGAPVNVSAPVATAHDARDAHVSTGRDGGSIHSDDTVSTAGPSSAVHQVAMSSAAGGSVATMAASPPLDDAGGLALVPGTALPIADAGAAPTAHASAFPAIADPSQAGPYTATTQVGPNAATIFYPAELTTDGLHHPILVWDNAGGVTGPSVYVTQYQLLASHGFVVFAPFSSSADGTEVRDGLAWLLAENDRPAGNFFDKLDKQKIGLIGHALGSIATFAVAADPRITTSVHISGATNKNVGQGHALLQDLHAPAAFFCDAGGGNSFAYGDPGASCQWDFDHTTTPVFLATVDNGTLPDLGGALVAWLRWLLLDDSSMKPMFVGGACTFCSRSGWSDVQQRGLAALP